MQVRSSDIRLLTSNYVSMPTLWGNKSGWAAKINSLDEKHPKAVSLYSTPNPSHLENQIFK